MIGRAGPEVRTSAAPGRTAAALGCAVLLHAAGLAGLILLRQPADQPPVPPDVVLAMVVPPDSAPPEPTLSDPVPPEVPSPEPSHQVAETAAPLATAPNPPIPQPPVDEPKPDQSNPDQQPAPADAAAAPVQPAPAAPSPAAPAAVVPEPTVLAPASAQPALPPRVLPPVPRSVARPPLPSHARAERHDRPLDAASTAFAAALPAPVLTPTASVRSAPLAAPEPPRDADHEAALEARIRDAVQAAVHYPAAARMMGLTGRARLELDYRAGTVTNPVLAQSAGAPVLDDAAMAAARTAHYPPSPPDIGARQFRLLVWVEFRPG